MVASEKQFRGLAGTTSCAGGAFDVIQSAAGHAAMASSGHRRKRDSDSEVANNVEIDDNNCDKVSSNKKFNAAGNKQVMEGSSSKSLFNSYDPGLNASTQLSFQNYYGAYSGFQNNGDYHHGGIHYNGDYYPSRMLNFFESGYNFWYSNGISIPPFAPQAETVISPYWMQPPSHWFQNLSGSNPSIIPSDTNTQTSIPPFAAQAETVISPYWMQPPSHLVQNLSSSNPSIIPSDTNSQTGIPSFVSQAETVISPYWKQPPSYWFQNVSGSNPSIIPSDTKSQTSIPSFASQAETVISPSWMQPPSTWFQNFTGSNPSILPSYSSPQTSVDNSNPQTSWPSSSNQKENQSFYAKLDKKFRSFKHFDTVSGHSDHWFKDCKAGGDLSKKVAIWSKAIQKEWKLLEDNLPDSIFVRVYEERIDLMRAVIIGAAGTPYHDGLFFFDILFPSTYPNAPPHLHYHSGGLRLNPNLYTCGTVCLSLLNTWSGSQTEMWTPGKSTMLQVLLSIQALVLNEKPYFNEPGLAPFAGHAKMEKMSEDYSENAFILSCKTMMYTLRKPPKHFEDFLIGHFRKRGHAILDACKAYMDGSQVATLASGGIQGADKGKGSCISTFQAQVGQIFPLLIQAFKLNGIDCRKYANAICHRL